MIDNLEQPLYPWPGKAVVKGGGCVEHDQGGTVDAQADNPPHVAIEASKDNQQNQARKAQGRTDAVCNTVGNFLSL